MGTCRQGVKDRSQLAGCHQNVLGGRGRGGCGREGLGENSDLELPRNMFVLTVLQMTGSEGQ